jgi:endo-1,4-beta-mannosidase
MPAADAAAPCLAGSSGGPFLRTDGAGFTCAGQPVALTGFTFYPAVIGGAKAWHSTTFTSYIDHVLDMGAAAGQNLIRATDQWDSHTAGQSADDPVVWANMDYLLKAARVRGVFVVVDLSGLRWVLMSEGKDPNRADLWTGFITKVATRYRDNPAVAFYSIAGEPKPPDTSASAAALTAFYRTTSEALRASDPNHLITVGGFNHMEDHPELRWWQAIDALPTNDIVAVKTYSQHDLNLMPAISSYGHEVGKPVVDEEFGMPQGYGDAVPARGTAFNGLTGGREEFFASVYSSGRHLGFAGFIFWNMGCQLGPTSYEVNPGTPAVWAVLVKYGAVPVSADGPPTAALCP